MCRQVWVQISVQTLCTWHTTVNHDNIKYYASECIRKDSKGRIEKAEESASSMRSAHQPTLIEKVTYDRDIEIINDFPYDLQPQGLTAV